MNTGRITGATRVACLLGHPARHSLSPSIHNSIFEAENIDAVYVAYEVLPDDLRLVVDALKATNFIGASITMPHKESVMACCDSVSPRARALSSVNTLVHGDDGRIFGDCTDGAGCVGALRASGVEVHKKKIVVVGAGATARACIAALAEEGPSSIGVFNRTIGRAREAVGLAGELGHIAEVGDIAHADIVVHATPAGMGEALGNSKNPPHPIDFALLHEGQVVLDVVYQPLQTNLLAAAVARGAVVVDGLSMLIHQAIEQQFLWIGRRALPEMMRSAAEHELAMRRR